VSNVSSVVTITDLNTNTLYDFRLCAKNESGISLWAEINNVKTLELPLLPVPGNFRTSVVAQTTLRLDWNSVEGADRYLLQRKISSGNTGSDDFETIYIGTESIFTDSQLTPNTQYEYRVKATSTHGNSDYTTLTAQTVAVTDNNGVDTPMFLSTEEHDLGNVTLEWTDLGENYTYVLYKAGRVVVNFDTDNSYTDNNPSASGVEGYALIAYHKPTGQLSSITMSVVHTTAKPVVITGYEVTPEGKFTLLWDAEPGISYNIFRSGRNLSGQLVFNNNNTGQWTDDNPLNNNDYMLVAIYQEGQTYRATFSNIFNLKTTTQSQAANAFDAFWADYDFNLVDDEILNAIA
jgi:hypothetical protein